MKAAPIQNEEFSKVTDLVYQNTADTSSRIATRLVVSMRLVLRKYCLTSTELLVIL